MSCDRCEVTVDDVIRHSISEAISDGEGEITPHYLKKHLASFGYEIRPAGTATPLQADAPELLRALADVAGNQLGRHGSFSCLPGDYYSERTEEILLLLLRHGAVVKAHTRAWRKPIPPELEPAMRAAGGQTYEEFMAEYNARKAREATQGGAA